MRNILLMPPLLMLAAVVHAQPSSFAATSVQTHYAGSRSLIATADFNGDGRADLATSNWCGSRCYSNHIAVFLAGPTGALQPPAVLQANLNPYRILVRDITGDNHPDILLSSIFTSSPLLFVNQGNGTFPATGMPIPVPGNGTITGDAYPVLADFNGDGRLDLVEATGGNFEVLLNTGSASTGWFAPTGGPAVAPYDGTVVLVAELNQDGYADIITITPPSGGMRQGTVRLNNGLGTAFTPGFTFNVSTANLSDYSDSGITLADFDGDGMIDLLTGTTFSGPQLYRNLGAGAFSTPSPIGLSANVTTGWTADFNNDGLVDLANVQSSGIAIHRNLGAGNFSTGTLTTLSPANGQLVAGDANGDGRLDLLASVGTSGVVTLLNTTVLATASPQPQFLTISPNPASDAVRLELPASTLPVRLELYNAMGQLVQSQKILSTTDELSVQALSPGLYTVRVQNTQNQHWMSRLQVR